MQSAWPSTTTLRSPLQCASVGARGGRGPATRAPGCVSDDGGGTSLMRFSPQLPQVADVRGVDWRPTHSIGHARSTQPDRAPPWSKCILVVVLCISNQYRVMKKVLRG